MELDVDNQLDGTGSGSGDEDSKLNVFEDTSVDSRKMMDALLDISEDLSEKQLCQARVETLLESQRDEREIKFNGWVAPQKASQKPNTINEQKKRKSNPYTGASDIDDFYLFKKKSYVLLPDYSNPGVMWRSIVEADTYRYVDDNGCYRYLKTNAVLGKDRPEIRSQFQKRQVHIPLARREIQREITRDLRRVVESRERLVETHTPSIRNDEVAQAVPSVADSVDGKFGEAFEGEDEPHAVSDNDVKNVPGAGVDGVKNRHADSPFQLPSVDVPLLSKAFAERLMENFSSKISALEEEIRKDAKLKMLQKSTEGTSYSQSQFRRSSLQDLTHETISALNQSRPGLDKRDAFPQSTFQVIKVYTGSGKPEQKVPLKPLEKVTPNMRQQDETHKMQVAHLRYNTLKGNTGENGTRYSFSDSVINPVHIKDNSNLNEKTNIDSEASQDTCLNINNIAVVGSVKSGEAGFAGVGRSTSQPLSGSKKGQTVTKKPKRSKSFFNETVEKNESGFHSAPVGKPKRDAKKTGGDTQNISRHVLPELMGKKMPVTVSVQKWL